MLLKYQLKSGDSHHDSALHAESSLTKISKPSPLLLMLPARVSSVGRCVAAGSLLQVKQAGQTYAEKTGVEQLIMCL